MKIISTHKLSLLFACAAVCTTSYRRICAEVEVMPSTQDIKQVLDSKLLPDPAEQDRTIRFAFANEELVDIIYKLAAQKNVNIIFPMGSNAITSKVTLSFEERLTLDEAWSRLLTILDVAGYSMIHEGAFYKIVKTDPLTSKEPLPLFVNKPINEIPDSDMRIRYIYFLTNIRVGGGSGDGSGSSTNELELVLKELLGDDVGGMKDAGKVLFDPNSNAMILTEKANNIRAAMKIIQELDRSTFQEKIEFVRLQHVQANQVADLFKSSILKESEAANKYRLDTKKRSEASYFSKNVKIVPENRTNSLIVLGRSQDVARIKNFIETYIDIELDEGKSVLHIYQLQYLEAQALADTLNAIIANKKRGNQSSGAAAEGAVERDFEGVIIMADTPRDDTGRKAELKASSRNNPQAELAQYSYPGGNKLVVAARQDDWRVIKQLIEQLDRPQPQVILEVFIVDITLDDPQNKSISAITRTPDNIPLFGTSEFQAAHQARVMTNVGVDTTQDATSIEPDLLIKAFTQSGGVGTSVSLASLVSPGSTVFSLGDKNGNVWSFIQTLQKYANVKILSQPHIIAMHNETATVISGEERLVVGDAETSTAATKQNQVYIQANLKVTLRPLISSSEEVHLSVDVDIDEFDQQSSSSSSDGNRNNRRVRTQVTMRNNNVLALGGLIKTITQDGETRTPILGRIPIIKWLFSSKEIQTVKSNLVVFISPTIVEPRLRGGMTSYTQDYISIGKRYAQDDQLFENLRDPITRWFFGPNDNVEKMIDDFTAKDATQNGDRFVEHSMEKATKKPTKREDRLETYRKKRKKRNKTEDILTDAEDLGKALDERMDVKTPPTGDADAGLLPTSENTDPNGNKEPIPVARTTKNLTGTPAMPTTVPNHVAQKKATADDTKEMYRQQLRQLMSQDDDVLTRRTLRT